MQSIDIHLPLLIKQLRLHHMQIYWEELLVKAQRSSWSADKYLYELLRLEVEHRDQKRLQRFMKEATLPSGKHLNNYDFSDVSGVTQASINPLVTKFDWVDRGDNVLIFGASGMGKTHLATAIGFEAVQSSRRVKFINANHLVQMLQSAKVDLKLTETLLKFDKYDMLILDDIGYVKKNAEETTVLFELIAHRYERKSIIVTSNHEFKDWDNIFDDSVMTVAAIDRLIHHAAIFSISSEQSYRKKEALKKQKT